VIILINKTDTGKYSLHHQIYIGRGSVLGNPFRIGKNGSRDEVIAKYRLALWADFKANGSKSRYIRRILVSSALGHNLALVCHCRPKACHGQVILDALDWLGRFRYEKLSAAASGSHKLGAA